MIGKLSPCICKNVIIPLSPWPDSLEIGFQVEKHSLQNSDVRHCQQKFWYKSNFHFLEGDFEALHFTLGVLNSMTGVSVCEPLFTGCALTESVGLEHELPGNPQHASITSLIHSICCWNSWMNLTSLSFSFPLCGSEISQFIF